MYIKHFGLQEEPFKLSTDPKFLFLSAAHARARAFLEFAIYKRDGIVAITGEIGSGKSTLVADVCQRIQPASRAVVLHQTQLSEVELMQAMLFGLGVTMVPENKAELLDCVRAVLINRHNRGEDTTLIVDEAQNLSTTVLEELRMLADEEYESDKLLTLVLVGQSCFSSNLAHPNLEQLRQRIRLNFHLEPLSEADTLLYIEYRLRVAGAASAGIFDPATIPVIYRYSGGVPRLINLLCDMALTAASLAGVHTVTAEIVRESVQELGWKKYSRRPRGVSAQLRLVAAWASELAVASRSAAGTLAERYRALQVGMRARDASQACARAIGRAARAARKAARRVPAAMRPLANNRHVAALRLGAARLGAPVAGFVSDMTDRQRDYLVAGTTLAAVVAVIGLMPAAMQRPVTEPAIAGAPSVRTASPQGTVVEVPAQQVQRKAQAAAETKNIASVVVDSPSDKLLVSPPQRPYTVASFARPPADHARMPQADFADAPAPGLRSADWIMQQPPQAYTIQVLGTRQYPYLNRFAARQGAKMTMAFYAAEHRGKNWYVLVTGVYDNYSAARSASGELPASMIANRPWVRTFAEVQEAIRQARTDEGAAPRVAKVDNLGGQ